MSESLEMFRKREQQLLCRTYSRYPLSVVRAKGARLWDADGKEYVDLLAGIAVTGLGHCNEEIAEVISRQARKLIHVSNLFYQEEQLDFAEKLLATSHAARSFSVIPERRPTRRRLRSRAAISRPCADGTPGGSLLWRTASTAHHGHAGRNREAYRRLYAFAGRLFPRAVGDIDALRTPAEPRIRRPYWWK